MIGSGLSLRPGGALSGLGCGRLCELERLCLMAVVFAPGTCCWDFCSRRLSCLVMLGSAFPGLRCCDVIIPRVARIARALPLRRLSWFHLVYKRSLSWKLRWLDLQRHWFVPWVYLWYHGAQVQGSPIGWILLVCRPTSIGTGLVVLDLQILVARKRIYILLQAMGQVWNTGAPVECRFG